MRNKLRMFISELASGDRTKYTSRQRGDDRLRDEFAMFLGFKPWNSPVMCPDCDPKWNPLRWSYSDVGRIDDVRLLSFNSLYSQVIKNLAVERNIILPNGWHLGELIDTLFTMRRTYKSFYIRLMDKPDSDECQKYNQYQMITKFLLNMIYSIICRYGSAINLGSHEIINRARFYVENIIRVMIDSGRVVLYVNVDEIVYVGDQFNVIGGGVVAHYEKYKTAVLPDRKGSLIYGNGIYGISTLPVIKFRIEEWSPLGNKNVEDQRIKAE